MDLGLQRLTNMLAQVPNTDYAVQGSKLADLSFVDLPAEDLLVVNAGSIERNNLKIQDAMRADMEWIKRSMDANGLVAAGPMRIVSTELARETYTFDVVVPVRRAGAAAAADTAPAPVAGQEGAAAAAPARAPVTAASGAPMSGLKLLGPVKYQRSEAGRYASATYVGYMAELETVRNALRAWTLTQGEEPTGLAFEVYKRGIDQSFTANGQYDIYWPVKK
jgi:hypothetical protein